MASKSFRSAVAVVLIAGSALALPSSDAFAQHYGGGGRGDGGPRHYYHNGSWYRHGWLGFDIAVGALAVGALIDALPPRCSTVVVKGVPYYYYGNYYYQPYPYGGYVVVPPPVLMPPVAVMPQAPMIAAEAAPVTAMATVAAPAITQAQTQAPIQGGSTINIPNSQGGYTAVTLRKAGTGYVGPQGEYYSDNPTVEQLKVLYGK